MATTAKPVKAREGEEVWELTVPGRVWVKVTKFTRTGHPVTEAVSWGPKKQGQQFRISTSDREMNQESVQDPQNDIFRNGMLVRVDADQNEDEDTASEDAVSTEDLLSIFNKNGNAFQSAVRKLGELPIRRMREIADAVDATNAQVRFLDELIEERYRRGGAQPDVELALDGSVRPDREGARLPRSGG